LIERKSILDKVKTSKSVHLVSPCPHELLKSVENMTCCSHLNY